MPLASFACSCLCAEPKPFKTKITGRFESSPIIFIGKAVEDTQGHPTITLAPGWSVPAINHRVRFMVEEAFKGVDGSTMTSNNGDGNCSYGEMEVGKSYLVYASVPPQDSPIFIGGCCNHSRRLAPDDRYIYSKREKHELVVEVAMLRELAARANKKRQDHSSSK